MPTATKGDQIKYGPVLLTDIISKNNLMHFVKEERIFHPIRYSHTRDFLNPFIFEYTKGLMANSIAISLFNSSWLMHSLEIPKMDSTPQENTLIGHLTKKYIPVELY
jgi:hypothetical protein